MGGWVSVWSELRDDFLFVFLGDWMICCFREMIVFGDDGFVGNLNWCVFLCINSVLMTVAVDFVFSLSEIWIFIENVWILNYLSVFDSEEWICSWVKDGIDVIDDVLGRGVKKIIWGNGGFWGFWSDFWFTVLSSFLR